MHDHDPGPALMIESDQVAFVDAHHQLRVLVGITPLRRMRYPRASILLVGVEASDGFAVPLSVRRLKNLDAEILAGAIG
jgi:hypothetical protein